MQRFLRVAGAIVIAVNLASAQIQFTDVAQASGITWRQGDPGNLMGAGGAFLDYDLDGWQDILLVGGDHAPALYRNQGDGTFVERRAAAGLPSGPLNNQWFMSAAVGDYDSDGDPDIYLGIWGSNRLFRNNGNGTFTDVTTAPLDDPRFTTASAFGDYDGDGHLDLYVGNYIASFNFPNHGPAANALYRNNGDGTWTDVTALTGVAGAGTTLAVAWSDFDADGDLDLFVGNDFGAFVQPNRLYRNDGPSPLGGPLGWQFTEISAQSGADPAIYCMGIAPGDYDRDGDLDYYFSNLGRNVLLRNDGANGFEDVTTVTGTENTLDLTTPAPHLLATSWGVGFHDFDLDGWLDLYVSNGHIPAAPFIANGLRTPNALFRHNGPALTFTDIAATSGVGGTDIGRGAAFGDYDRDGDVDILQINVNGRPQLYRNDTPRLGRQSLTLLPRGRVSARDATGTRVVASIGGTTLLRELARNTSFESSSEHALFLGLGLAPTIDRLQIRWPSGISHEVFDVPAGWRLPLVEPLITKGPLTTTALSAGAGQRATIDLELWNRSFSTASVQTVLELRVGGVLIWTGPAENHVLTSGTTRLVRFSADIPASLTTPVAVEARWTIIDPEFAIDQARTALQIGG